MSSRSSSSSRSISSSSSNRWRAGALWSPPSRLAPRHEHQNSIKYRCGPRASERGARGAARLAGDGAELTVLACSALTIYSSSSIRWRAGALWSARLRRPSYAEPGTACCSPVASKLADQGPPSRRRLAALCQCQGQSRAAGHWTGSINCLLLSQLPTS